MSLAEYAAREGLHKVGGRPPIFAYLADVWRRRAFIYSLARFRIEADNGRNRLGMGWVVLKPLINAAVYGTIFGILLGRANRPDQFILFLVIGVFFFEYFSSCFTSGAKSITKNANLVQSLSFPRMSLPLALVVQRLLEFAPMIVIMLGLVLGFGNAPMWEWLLLIPLVVLFTVFNVGLDADHRPTDGALPRPHPAAAVRVALLLLHVRHLLQRRATLRRQRGDHDGRRLPADPRVHGASHAASC